MTRIALHLDEGETDTCEVDFRARTWLSSDTRWAAGVRERHRKQGREKEREPLLGLTRAAWAWACACVRMGVGGGASSGFAEGDAGGRTRQLEWIRNQITAVTRVPLRARLLLRRGVQLFRNPEKRCLIITTHELIVLSVWGEDTVWRPPRVRNILAVTQRPSRGKFERRQKELLDVSCVTTCKATDRKSACFDVYGPTFLDKPWILLERNMRSSQESVSASPFARRGVH